MKKLDHLKKLGIIKSYKLVGLGENGEEAKSGFRNTEQLTIVFQGLNNTDETLVIDTFCSGCREDTYLSIS